ncbi:isoform X1 [Orobanche minor]
MERRRRTGGERGGRGMEENTMAILDTSGFSNSKISHHLDDDRASCFYGSSENLFFPIMEDTGLFDLHLHRRSFTWYRADGTCKSRIDRMMVNEDWLSKCPGSVLLGACRGSFDHCPLILQLKFVKVKWEGYASEGWAGFILKEKLKSLKADLRWWSKNIYGNLDNRVKDRKEVLERLDAIVDSRGLGEADIIERNKLRALLIRDLKERNVMLRQKAKAKWVVEGDKNTSYFYRCINGRLKSNEIVELMINDRWSEDVEDVKNAARDKFKAHFSEVQICRPKLRSNFFLTKTNEKDNARLIANFTDAETWEIIKSCSGDKSPGPNGLNMHIFQSCWHFMKKDVMDFLFQFHSNGVCRKKKAASFWYKIDIAKACDSVNWAFLDEMLTGMGFAEKWRRWISECVSTAHVNVLVNDSPSGDFQIERGLRQGGPLSPFLFVIIAECISLCLEKAVQSVLFDPLEVGRGVLKVSHLIYVDDSIIKGNASIKNALFLKRLLVLIELVLGLRVNVEKCNLVGLFVEQKMCEAIFHIMKDVDSLDLIIESYQLLVKLDKRFPRVYLSKQEQADSSSPSKVIPQVIMVEEAWVPFTLGLDSYNEKGAAKNHSGSSIDSSGFHALIHEIDEVFKGMKSEGNVTTFLKNMLLLQYLISVLEGDFIPRNCAYHGNHCYTCSSVFCRDQEKLCTKKNGKETINSSSIQFVTIGERGVVRIWNSDGAVLLFEQKSSDLAVSSKKDDVKRGFTSAMMLPLGQGLLCATVDEQFLIYSVDKHADGGLNLFMRKRLIGYEIAATQNLD